MYCVFGISSCKMHSSLFILGCIVGQIWIYFSFCEAEPWENKIINHSIIWALPASADTLIMDLLCVRQKEGHLPKQGQWAPSP